MEKEKSELEEFMGDLASGSQTDLLENKSEDPFGHLEKQDNELEEEKKEEKPLPFHKDPKVQKFIDKEVQKALEKVKPETVPEILKPQEDDYYVRLIGNDTPEKVAMIKEAIARDERMLQQAEERAFNRLSQKEQEAKKAELEAEAELESAFDNIEENYNVDISSNAPLAKKTRQEFGAYIERIAPKDREGNIVAYPDMNAAWETFSELKKSTAQPSRAKELASRSMSRSAETSNAPVLKRGGTPFSNSDAFIESLSK